jgi:hypothetical protein
MRILDFDTLDELEKVWRLDENGLRYFSTSAIGLSSFHCGSPLLVG